jgi:hypothetical protein
MITMQAALKPVSKEMTQLDIDDILVHSQNRGCEFVLERVGGMLTKRYYKRTPVQVQKSYTVYEIPERS